MNSVIEIIQREAVYLWFYFDVQIREIFWFWVFGIVLGSCVSVFFKNSVHLWAERIAGRVPGIISIIAASVLGIASPLCMYGTIPICAAFARKGVKEDFLAAFMMSSVLLNPQLIAYSAALGKGLLWTRIVSCFLCGIFAGLLVRAFFCKKNSDRHFFNFSGFDEPHNHDTDPNIALRFLKNIWRNVRATGPWFLLGIALSAVFQRYVPGEAIGKLFGENEGFGILLAAGAGVPLYVCGGGTIPLLLEWLSNGMSYGSAAAFMLTGPATKITNLGALKTVLGFRNFVIYIAFVVLFSLFIGGIANWVLF